MKKNIDYIKFAIEQAIKAEEFGFSRNECNRNLKTALHQYWQTKELRQSGIKSNSAQRKNIPRSSRRRRT